MTSVRSNSRTPTGRAWTFLQCHQDLCQTRLPSAPTDDGSFVILQDDARTNSITPSLHHCIPSPFVISPRCPALTSPVARRALLCNNELSCSGAQKLSSFIDGKAEYDWRLDDYEQGFDHKTLMQKLGTPLLRSFPQGFPKRDIFPHLMWLGHSRNVRVTGLNLLHSPSWTFALYGCRQVSFDQLYIYTSLKEAVWADGIDLDGCTNVTISTATRCLEKRVELRGCQSARPGRLRRTRRLAARRRPPPLR